MRITPWSFAVTPDLCPDVTTQPRRGVVVAALAAVRPGQWVKNLLLFVPAVTSHLLFVERSLERSVVGFVAFCCCASAGYLLNDLVDRRHDQLHPRKRARPFAAGELSVAAGVAMIAILAIAGATLAFALPGSFRLTLASYVVITAAYSLALKRYLMIDVIVLAALYTLRIIGGTTAITVVLSPWLLAFSMFLFFSLALVKRTSELEAIRENAPAATAGRAYELSDANALAGFGYASACTAVLVLALYVNSPDVAMLYRHPVFLWGLAPLVLYFLARLWIVARRGYVEGDPLLYAARDRASYVMLAAALLLVWLAL